MRNLLLLITLISGLAGCSHESNFSAIESISAKEKPLKIINGEAMVGDTKHSKVNINTADEKELDTLPGIGPAMAKAIIYYRNNNGGFKNIEELKNVKGIGDSKYKKIEDCIEL